MADITLFECQNCLRVWDEKELINPIPHLEDRVSPGEPVPYGECPGPGNETCGALCHPHDDDYIDICPIDSCEKGQIRLIGFEATCDAAVGKDGWDLTTSSMDSSEEKFRCTEHGPVPEEWVFKRMSRKDAVEAMKANAS